MFDLRYHVASLAAVFIALVIGIVVGVGLSESGVTKQAELEVAQRDLERSRIELERKEVELRQSEASSDAVRDMYPALMEQRLAGKNVAVLFVGPADGDVREAIERTLADADAQGGGTPLRIRALKVPIDGAEIDRRLQAASGEPTEFAGEEQLPALGRALAAEFVHGGVTPLWDLLSSHIVEQRSGGLATRADAVVVARTVDPQMGPTARFLAGLVSGLGAQGVPTVAVEASDAEHSAIPVFRNRGLSTVDSVDLATGRLALALLLAGSTPGQYGVKQEDGGDGVLPPVVPVAVAG